MNKDYDIFKFNNSRYDLIGIVLNDNRCCFWKNKSSVNIDNIIVIISNSNVINLKNNEMCISLEGVKNINNQKELLIAFAKEISKMGIDVKRVKFRFVVSSNEEEIIANRLNNELGIKGEIVGNNNYEVQKREEDLSKQQLDISSEDDAKIDNNLVKGEDNQIEHKEVTKNNYGYKFDSRISRDSYDNNVANNMNDSSSKNVSNGIKKGLRKGNINLSLDTSNMISNYDRSRAAFVSLPVILFIISFCLLVGSGIILLMMK